MTSISIMMGLSTVLLLLAVLEVLVNNHRLDRIPIRIHVNGIRGKSTTTRLIAAGLRAAGIPTLAKTTGSAAMLILPDGSEIPIDRKRVSIQEQLWVIKVARSLGVKVLVIECMALSPENQWVSQNRMIKAPIGVITNIRADHQDEMGSNLSEVAAALAMTIPSKGNLVVGDENFLPFLKEQAAKKGSTLHSAGPHREIELAGSFFPDNIYCALEVCRLVGVPWQIALDGMDKVRQDPGALSIQQFQKGGREVRFINAFAANDPVSTRQAWEVGQAKGLFDGACRVGLLNSRLDRPWRSVILAELTASQLDLDYLVLIGGAIGLTKRYLLRHGFPKKKIIDLHRIPPGRVISSILELTGADITIFAFGNIHGGSAETIVSCFTSKREVS